MNALLARPRVLNFDHSVTRQKNLMGRFRPDVVDLASLGPTGRIWTDHRTAEQVRAALQPDLKSAVTLLGSGDFHQMSSLLIRQFDEPLSVVVFDHHPDWDLLPPRLHCGSWVTDVLRTQPNVQKLLLIGVSSDDISAPWIYTGNLGALADDRVEIYPYRHRPTRTWLRRVPANRSIRVTRGWLSNTIHWQELGATPLDDFFLHRFRELTPRRVYVSLDKDCLTPSDALTNWEGGCLSLGEVLRILQLLESQCDVVGCDIVGEYSPPVVKGRWKALWAAMDRPRNSSANGKPRALIDEINEDTNLRLLERLVPAPAVHATSPI